MLVVLSIKSILQDAPAIYTDIDSLLKSEIKSLRHEAPDGST